MQNERSVSLPSAKTPDDMTQKARMLITILGTEFTRSSSHPFFRSLAETAARPVKAEDKKPDISRALKNLMTHLAARPTPTQTPVKANTPSRTLRTKPDAEPETKPVQNRAVVDTDLISPNQHPALIASSLLNRSAAERSKVMRTLKGPVARRVLVYLRELSEKAA